MENTQYTEKSALNNLNNASQGLSKIEKTLVTSSIQESKNTRVDYSKTFDKEVAENFKEGYKIFSGPLKEDLFLVQFHGDTKARSLKYWTSLDQANKMSTMDDVVNQLALLPEWGNRNTVTIAKVSKGTTVNYCVGEAKDKTSKFGKIYKGDGDQYLFRDFDKSWVLKTRMIPK